jgi:dihydropteroate synthase
MYLAWLRMPDFAIMGIINVTPDSFSDGGLFLDPAVAVDHGLMLQTEGATILDVGGESTRPGADRVSVDEELRRVIPVIEGLVAAGTGVKVSVDTSKAEVVERALEGGATLVNDVAAMRLAPAIAELTAAAGAELCLMHMVGSPRTMQDDPYYDDVVSDVKRFLEQRMTFAIAHGVAEEKIILDPGIGFGKTVAHNLALLQRLPELVALGRPVMVGTSRKSFIGKLTGREIEGRTPGTLATNVIAYERGARLFRVHDVGPTLDALTVTAATLAG